MITFLLNLMALVLGYMLCNRFMKRVYVANYRVLFAVLLTGSSLTAVAEETEVAEETAVVEETEVTEETAGLEETTLFEGMESQGTTAEKSTTNLPQWIKNIKFSGYGMLQYQGQDKYENKSNSFKLRLMRLILDGKIGDFDWRVQIQGTSEKGAGEATVSLMDLYAEWVRYKALRVRAGQFKRAFTFENPTHPITQGWYAYADVINQLAAFGDRTGEKSSSGRDIGVQLQGDILPNSEGRALVHYQVGVYNGEGINSRDKDNRKDLIGGFWVMPVKGLRIGASGWMGSHGNMTVGYETVPTGLYVFDANNNKVEQTTQSAITASVPLNRYALSAEYDKDEYTFRAEYIHSQGWGSGVVGSTVVNYNLGDKADGWYAFGIVPVIKSKLHLKARYQTYRKSKEWSTSKTMYEIGANYFFTKNLQLNFEYARVNDRSIANADKHNYNFVDLQLDFRF